MSLNTVTLTWNLTDFLQNPVSVGEITVAPSSEVSVQSAGKLIVPQARFQVFTSGTGSMAGIVATDNTGMEPATFLYKIFVIDAVDTRFTWIGPFLTPIAYANGATQDLAVLLAAVL